MDDNQNTNQDEQVLDQDQPQEAEENSDTQTPVEPEQKQAPQVEQTDSKSHEESESQSDDEEAPEAQETQAEDVATGDDSQVEPGSTNQPEEAVVVEKPQEVQPEAESAEEPAEVAEPETKEDDESETQPTTDEQPTPDSGPGKWYVVHTYSGHENRVATTLKQRIESEHLGDKILDILVPTQNKIEIRGGKKMDVKEKIFPGYILVKMVLDDNTWLAVRTTQGVTSFVGMGNKPTPISEQEVRTIVQFTQIAQPTFKQVFSVNDTVKIIDGPFAEFIGKVDSVDEEKGKVRVLVSIFGRETPVELDFLQVQKI